MLEKLNIGSRIKKSKPDPVKGALNAHWKITLLDKHMVPYRRIQVPAQSLVIAAADLMYQTMADDTLNINDTGSVARSVGDLRYFWRAEAAVTDDTMGIILGTDNTATTLTDDAIGTLIDHGVAAGDLLYGSCETGAPILESGPAAVYAVLSRLFVNRSGGNITVEEVALYVLYATFDFMIERTVINFTINDTDAALVEYHIGATA